MNKIKKNTVVITGGGTGIGRSLAIKVAAKGHSVIAVGRRKELLEETQEHNPELIKIISLDITIPDSRQKLFRFIDQQDINSPIYLVNNAATAAPLKKLSTVNLEEWRALLTINLESPLFLMQALLPYLKNGRILNISSGLAHYCFPGAGAYCVSKAGLYMLYQCLREELKELNIAVGSADPGIVDTPMQEFLRTQDKKQFANVDMFIDFKKQGILVSPDEVAEFLAALLLETSNEKFSSKEWTFKEFSSN